jgi:hypothetical protein
LAQIYRQIESLESMEVVSDQMRALIEQQWPHVLAKINGQIETALRQNRKRHACDKHKRSGEHQR